MAGGRVFEEWDLREWGEFKAGTPPPPVVPTVFWDRTLLVSLTVPADKTYPTHELLIANGVTLTVSDTGCVLAL